jgi:hypothetical protein
MTAASVEVAKISEPVARDTHVKVDGCLEITAFRNLDDLVA